MKNKTLKYFILMVTILLTTFQVGCKSEEKMVSDSTYMLGTYLQLSVWTSNEAKGMDIIKTAFERIKEIEDKMSANIDESEIGQINQNAGRDYVEVSEETSELIKKAVHYAQVTDGAFDPAIGKLVKLWGIGTENERIPSEDEIRDALSFVDYRKIEFQGENKVKLSEPEMRIDLGGIAKGYAADEVTKIMREKGIKHAIINLGGNVVTLGKKTDGSSWKIGIQDPFEPTGTHMGIIEAHDQTVVTSGNYERYFIQDDKRYHHIIDPKSGYPAENGIVSASIITNSSTDADGLSTSVYVLGLDKGMKLIESLDGVECIIITEDKKVYLSSGLTGRFQIINNSFQIVN
ncbi:thiamine biosynthesis lipoprotein [Anaerosolibacter carboniphilus]|uniref:FAD:protein FMN transferase n=1 Tax=Anaerosolibacter carboniphilus TaxID=1417629 RepID=A0A841KS63_9FIRM|nr:FAD:protein FMN transferase [Anaerosolibacter carboniphilus]MBB6214890.1 thiamine biosynthesis lipoprotein [Anaerosolibacter carboniphilus]